MRAYKPKPYSVREVAIRLSSSRREDGIEFLMRQIKHWTNNDLIHTTGNKNTGTGRSREYSREETIAAAYLLELSKYGFTVGQLVRFRSFFDLFMRDQERRYALLGKTDRKGNGGYILYYGWGDKPNKSSGMFLFHSGVKLNAQSLWQLNLPGEDIDCRSILMINCFLTVKRLDLD